jgi:hypothetical protein
MFTEETPMMAEWSPIKIAAQSTDTFDKNVLKFILTGIDDASIVETPNPNEQRIANAGKIEIVEELIEAAVADLHRLFSEDDAVDKLQVASQEAALSNTLEEQHAKLARSIKPSWTGCGNNGAAAWRCARNSKNEPAR